MSSRTYKPVQQTSTGPTNEEPKLSRSIILPMAPCVDPKVPPIFLTKKGSTFNATGENMSRSFVDDLIKTGKFSSGVSSWYDAAVAVKMETYGGTPNEKAESKEYDIGDLCCLFYSCLKTTLPELENISQDWVSGETHAFNRGEITRQFKGDIATYLFTDLNQPTEEELAESGLTAEEYTHKLEKRIKKKYTIINENARREFSHKINDHFNLEDQESKRNLIQRLNLAIESRQQLLLHRMTIRNQITDPQENINLIQNLVDIDQQLENPDLEYNVLLSEFEELYLDPRFHKWQNSDVGIPGEGFQYAFCPEIRNLPLTMGIFNLPVMFNTEGDFRSDEFGGAINIPNQGSLKPETIIDQLFYRKEHGALMLRLISEVTGFNIFALNEDGEPHFDIPYQGPNTHDYDIISIWRDRIASPKGEFVTRNIDIFQEFSNLDAEAPCILIVFNPGHFESVGLLHQVEFEDSENCKKHSDLYQLQTVFSFFDPFIQQFGEYDRERRTPVAQKAKIAIKPSVKPSMKPSLKPVIKPQYTMEQLLKAEQELESEGFISEDMSAEDQLQLIKEVAENLGISVDKYVKDKAEEYDSKHNTPTPQAKTEKKETKPPSSESGGVKTPPRSRTPSPRPKSPTAQIKKGKAPIKK